MIIKHVAEGGPPVVVVVDDDPSVREALDGLFRSVGLVVETLPSAAAYHAAKAPDRPGCFVIDVRLPGKSGLEFQDELAANHDHRPIIFLSGHADVAMCARAMKAGAVEFLTKPVRDQDLLDAVQAAITLDLQRRQHGELLARRRRDLASLTPREREILDHVVAGRRNKQIAADVGISEGTVKIHRGQIMRKLNTSSVADLVRLVEGSRTS